MTAQEKLQFIPTPQKEMGSYYIDAIDGNDTNHMPSDGYCFYEDNDGSVSVSYIQHFACWDGWDCMDSDCGDYNSMVDAINAIYEIVTHERIWARANENLNTMSQIAINNISKAITEKKGYSDLFGEMIPVMLFRLESKYT